MSTNLAQQISEAQGKLVSFPKKEKRGMPEKQNGFTPLPNFICDEGYLAELSGDAVKCLVCLNRHVDGFHLESKQMAESIVMKITGIKDKRTIRKNMADLAKFNLVKVKKSNGKSNVYSLSFDERLPVKPVASHVPSTSNAGTSHATTPVTCHVPTTSDMPCHPLKEIDLKENIKEKRESEMPVEKFEDELFSEYLAEHTDPISLKLLSRKQVSLPADLRVQAKKINSELCDDLITAEIKGFAQWSLTRNPVTPQTWMNYWIRRIQNLKGSNSTGLKRCNSTDLKTKAKKFTGLSDSQCNVFANKICADENFASQYAEVGETQKQFVLRITEKLKDPTQVFEWTDYLRAVGFEGNLGEQA